MAVRMLATCQPLHNSGSNPSTVTGTVSAALCDAQMPGAWQHASACLRLREGSLARRLQVLKDLLSKVCKICIDEAQLKHRRILCSPQVESSTWHRNVLEMGALRAVLKGRSTVLEIILNTA